MSQWLIGLQEHTIDEKNRFFIPSKFRDKLGSPVIVTKSVSGGCLRMYSKEGFDDFVKSIMQSLRENKENGEKKVSKNSVISWIGRNSEEMPVDAQGRIALPTEFKEYAMLNKNIISAGSFTYVEIWDKDRYNFREEQDKNADFRDLLNRIDD